MVAIRDLFKEAGASQLTRLHEAIFHVLEPTAASGASAALIGADGEALVHGIAELHGAEQRTNAPTRRVSALPHRIDRPVQRYG